MTAYYNEIDPYAADWLRNLIKAGHIAPGVVDERSIEDVSPVDLTDFTQCHFFAGIGAWSLALRQTGWPDDRPVWTGSCPCQPFSSAGKSAGFDDERHLWPAWFHLIEQRRPRVIFGEQVASKDGLNWLDLVQADLEGARYANGAVDLCAAGVGAPHIRQRLFFVGDSDYSGPQEHGQPGRVHLGITDRTGSHGLDIDTSVLDGVADSADSRRRESLQPVPGEISERSRGDSLIDQGDPGPTNGLWRAVDWLLCRDGKWRCVRPGTFPLVDGAPGRVGRLRAYGNAISPEVARIFIESYLES